MKLSPILPLTSFLLLINPIFALTNQQTLLSPQIQNQQKKISQPLLGFGTWNLKSSDSGENTTASVSYAIQTGYRQIDCAAIYRNEKAVGKGIVDGLEKANLTRGEIWVTSKLWNDRHGDYETVEKGLNQTLEDLGLEYLDLYLMHWPVGTSSSSKKPEFDYVKTWTSLTQLPKTRVRNIGISNFSPKQLRDLISKTGVKPAVHQMELHPYLQQSPWIATHEALGIAVTAYSPFANRNPIYNHSSSSFATRSCSMFSTVWDLLFGKKGEKELPPPLLENPTVYEIAERRNCTPAQVALAWGIGRGTSVIPKSSHENWIKENYESLKCELGVMDLVELKKVGVESLKRFNNPSKAWGVKLFDGLDDA